MPPARPAPAARPAVLVAVLLAHAGLWWVAQAPGVWRERRPPPPSAPPLQVRLFVPAPPAPDEARLPPPAPRQPPMPVPLAAPAVGGISAPEAPALQWVAPPSAPQPAAAPPPPAAAAPLLLDLPRRASAPTRSPALDDPRANTRRQTLESRIAGATGGDTDTGGPWTEEPLAGGLMRIRRGRECWIVAPNRDGQLDPFNQSATSKPRAATAC